LRIDEGDFVRFICLVVREAQAPACSASSKSDQQNARQLGFKETKQKMQAVSFAKLKKMFTESNVRKAIDEATCPQLCAERF